MAELSTKPYLVRAIHEWCVDSGYRPHIAVMVDEHTVVPREYVRAGEIVLNVSPLATNRLQISNETIEFEARFGGVARRVSVPIANVTAIYAQENGHGMAFEVPKALAVPPADEEQHEPELRSIDGGAGGEQANAEASPAADRPARRRPRPVLAAVTSVPPESSEQPQASPSSQSAGDAASSGDNARDTSGSDAATAAATDDGTKEDGTGPVTARRTRRRRPAARPAGSDASGKDDSAGDTGHAPASAPSQSHGHPPASAATTDDSTSPPDGDGRPDPSGGGRPRLRRVK